MGAMFKALLNFLWRRNPVTRIVYSRAHIGLKIIALSLVLILLGAIPFLGCWIWQPEQIPYWTAVVFAGSAGIAHVGFVLGLLLLIREMFRQ